MRFHFPLLAAVLLASAFNGMSPSAHAGPPQPATPEDIRQWVSEAADFGEEEAYANADLVYLLDEADVYVQPSGLATTESCELIRIMSPAGVRSQSVQRFDYDPATRRVTIEALRVHRADGTVDEIPVEAQVTQPTVQYMIYWGGEQHVIGVPDLAVGDTIELRISKIGFNIAYLGSDNGHDGPAGENGEALQPPMPGHWYEVTRFQGSHPIVRKRYSVHMPADKPVQYEVYNGALKTSLWFDDDRHVYTFEAADVPAVEREPHMEALDDCVTKVVMATVPDWEMKSRWFHEVNEAQFAADDAIRQKVAEITAGLTDLDDKIAACNHWVADNIRYYGTSRGPCEGFTLHTGIETFRDRGGVCKDKAGMLVTMLRVLGVEAYPALTMAGSRVEDIPADQFNHTVTVMKDANGEWRILDPTWIPLSREMWSSREALQGLVYGTPEGETLTLSPYYPPTYNQLTCQAKSSLSAAGDLQTRIDMEMQGYPDTYLRRNVHRYRPAERREAFAGVLNVAPNARLVDLAYTDPYDYSRDATVRLEATADAYAAEGTNLWVFRLPLMSHPLGDWLYPDLFYDFAAEERDFGYRMRATRGLRFEETITLPEGWSVVKLPEAESVDAEAARLTFNASTSGNTITYTFEFDLKQHIIPAEAYPEAKKALDRMHELSEAWVVCSVEEEATVGSKHAAANWEGKEVPRD